MPRVLIIGYGNPLKSDDGLGWHAALQLSRQFLSPEIRVIHAHQLLPELAEEASGAELVIFIDARQGGSPGEISRELLQPGKGSSAPALHSHDLSPLAILQLASELYGATPLAYLLTVSGQHFQDGESLSEPVLSAIPKVIAEVKSLISTR
jgi:hydrogenase maturation protease